MEITFRIFDDVNLVGHQIEGKKHGEFYYQFADGSKEYAGAYEFDQKHGIWYDIQSYVKDDCYGFYRQYKMNTSDYFNGIRLPIIGKLDQYGKKQGEWIETEGVHRRLFEKGTYCDNKRIGAWITYYDGHICGGGSYNYEGIKIGLWIEADVQYDNYQLYVISGYYLTFSGEYDNGERVGRWKYLNEQNEIGGGTYENGMKQGRWIELPEEIRLMSKITEEGEYLNDKRVGYWVILTCDQLIGRGIYDENGLKQGHWIEPHNTLQDYLFLNCSLTTCFGEYADGLRKGEWTYICLNQKIGGGSYNQSGVKTGKWIEPHDLNIEITYSGEYKEGVQVGNWKTFYDDQEIGGGTYDEKGVKIGYWIELFKNSHDACQRIQKGLYEKGTRIGKWKITLNSKEIQSQYWGEFDLQGMKTGLWIEPSERNSNHEIKLKFTGKYNKGLRTGRWKTLLNEELIGGGIYDDHGKKNDKWIDIHELEDSFLTFHGLYKAGIKRGQWEIKEKDHIKIGGGYYDTNGVKFGEWHDLDERFQEEKYEPRFILGRKTLINCVGMYNDYGFRTGEWKMIFENLRICGGKFNQVGLKEGAWTELFQSNLQNAYNGNYRNGIKYGKWKIQFERKVFNIENFDQNEQKQGLQRVFEQVRRGDYFVYSGEFKNNQRIGMWNVYSQNVLIGGGNYDQEGLKFGKWKDIQDMSNGEKFIDQDKIYVGEFKQGIRIGRWSIWYKSHHIGGGGYDNNGLKQGYWIDPEKDYNEVQKITFRGIYKDSKRIGEWSIYFHNHEIGGGNYNDKGQKYGQWIENYFNNYSYQCQLTSQGEYHEDVKIGEWKILYKRRKIGEGFYDNKGFKQGIWTETDFYFDNWNKKMLTGHYNNDKRNGVWKEMINDETNYKYYINGKEQKN